MANAHGRVSGSASTRGCPPRHAKQRGWFLLGIARTAVIAPTAKQPLRAATARLVLRPPDVPLVPLDVVAAGLNTEARAYMLCDDQLAEQAQSPLAAGALAPRPLESFSVALSKVGAEARTYRALRLSAPKSKASLLVGEALVSRPYDPLKQIVVARRTLGGFSELASLTSQSVAAPRRQEPSRSSAGPEQTGPGLEWSYGRPVESRRVPLRGVNRVMARHTNFESFLAPALAPALAPDKTLAKGRWAWQPATPRCGAPAGGKEAKR
jgi:hypothetical protein